MIYLDRFNYRHIVIFEDYKCRNFSPLSLTRPVFMLKSGFFPLFRRVIMSEPRAMMFISRDYLSDYTEEKTGLKVFKTDGDEFDGGVLFLNGRVIDLELPREMEIEGNVVGIKDGNVAFIGVKDRKLVRNFSGNFFFDEMYMEKILDFKDFNVIEVKNLRMADYIWEIIEINKNVITEDFNRLEADKNPNGKIGESVHIIQKYGIYVGKSARIYPGVVIDSEDGPVYIDDGVKIMPGSYIAGPCYIGSSSVIKPQSYIGGGTTVGEVCKVGGEVENSIIHAFSNKQHYGFLGDSYIGEWCNLGAGTCTSNLKNNYGSIKVSIDGNNRVNTGLMFLGAMIGDHSKIGIGTMLNSGTVVGVMCNIFGGGVISGFVPSFSWGGRDGFTIYKIDRALETAVTVMSRRGKTMRAVEKAVLDELYRRVNGSRV